MKKNGIAGFGWRDGLRRTGARGFSLTELMIAIGILGIGLGMAAALFPAGMKNSQTSTRNVLGMIICENGMAVVRARLKLLPDANGNYVLFTSPSPGGEVVPHDDFRDLSKWFAPTYEDLRYPDPPGTLDAKKGMRGFLVLGRRMAELADDFRNDYQIVIISYVKINPTNAVETIKAECAIYEADASNGLPPRLRPISTKDVDMVKLRSPALWGVNGNYATVTSLRKDDINDNYAYLSASLDAPAGSSVRKVWVVVEKQPNTNPPVYEPESPAATILITRTSLPRLIQ